MSIPRPKLRKRNLKIYELNVLFSKVNVTLWSNEFPSFYNSGGNVYDLTNSTFEIDSNGFPEDILHIFNTINTLGNDFVCNTGSIFNNRIDPSSGMPVKPSKRTLDRRDETGMDDKLELAYSICCAYSALVMAYAFVKAIIKCTSTKSSESIQVCIKKFLNGLVTAKNANEENKKNLLEIETLHMGINAYNGKKTNVYGDNSVIGRINKCPTGINLQDDGVHLFSIVSQFYSIPGTNDIGCGTAHHFMVYKMGIYCIIYDTWLGGPQGSRCNWTRILSTDQFIYLIDLMNHTETSIDIKEEIILKIFAGPNKNGQGYKHDYYFRYYTQGELVELIEKNSQLVREYIQQYPLYKHDKDAQQYFQREVYGQPPKQIRQPEIQSSLGSQLRIEDASVPVESGYDFGLIDEMANADQLPKSPGKKQRIYQNNSEFNLFDGPDDSDFNPDEMDNFGEFGGGSRKLKRKTRHKRKNKRKTKRKNINNK
jgi:hypothetical protein